MTVVVEWFFYLQNYKFIENTHYNIEDKGQKLHNIHYNNAAEQSLQYLKNATKMTHNAGNSTLL